MPLSHFEAERAEAVGAPVEAEAEAALAEMEAAVAADVETLSARAGAQSAWAALTKCGLRVGCVGDVASPYKARMLGMGIGMLPSNSVFSCDMGTVRRCLLSFVVVLDVVV